MEMPEITQRTVPLKKTLFYQLILGCFLVAGTIYFKGDVLSLLTGFILGQAYAGFTFWLIIQLFKGKTRALVFGAFVIKWGVLALILYFLLKKVHAISFTVGLMGFISFWFFLALEDWRNRKSQPAS